MGTVGHRSRGKLPIRRAAMASLVFFAAVSCGGDDPAGPSPTRGVVASVTVSPATTTLSSPGDTVRLTAEALDGQGNAVASAEFSWASSDRSVVTVDGGGLVTAVGGGTTTVTARESSAGLSATALLVVADEPRHALLYLYVVLGGSGWTNSNNWGTEAPLDTWYGVATDERGRVIELDLSDNGLTGSIPPELARLATLVVLNLSGNDASAASQLDPDPGLSPDVSLDPDPDRDPDVPGGTGLAETDTPPLAQEGLTGLIPPELGALSELRTLNLSGNSLTGPIPPQLGRLVELETLDLGLNGLTGQIPPELGRLAQLEGLYLSDNSLTGSIPLELADLPNLQELSLTRNDLTGPIPRELAGLPNLADLWLSSNELAGSIPPELGNLASLEALVLRDNDLTGQIPPELGNLSNLWGLSVSDNDLTGRTPSELGSLTNLTQLSLSRNRLTGPIPLELTAPGTPDLMSYCHPTWIGDYGFTKALRFRLEDEASAPSWSRLRRVSLHRAALTRSGE